MRKIAVGISLLFGLFGVFFVMLFYIDRYHVLITGCTEGLPRMVDQVHEIDDFLSVNLGDLIEARAMTAIELLRAEPDFEASGLPLPDAAYVHVLQTVAHGPKPAGGFIEWTVGTFSFCGSEPPSLEKYWLKHWAAAVESGTTTDESALREHLLAVADGVLRSDISFGQ